MTNWTYKYTDAVGVDVSATMLNQPDLNTASFEAFKLVPAGGRLLSVVMVDPAAQEREDAVAEMVANGYTEATARVIVGIPEP